MLVITVLPLPILLPTIEAGYFSLKMVVQRLLTDSKICSIAHQRSYLLKERIKLVLVQHAMHVRSYEGSYPLATLNQPQPCQLIVCLDNGIGSNGQLAGQLTHRGQLISSVQDADLQRVGDLLHQLHIDRHTAARIDIEPVWHPSPPLLNCIRDMIH